MIGAALAGSAVSAFGANKAAKAQEAAAANQLALQKQVYNETKRRMRPFYQSGLDFQNALRFELLGGERPVFGGTPASIEEVTTGAPSSGGYIGQNISGATYDPAMGMWSVGTPGGATQTQYRVGDEIFDTRAAARKYARANPTGGTEYGGFEATPYQNYLLQTTQSAVDSSAASRGNLFSGATVKAQQDRSNVLAGAFYGDYLNRLTGQASSGQAAAGNMAQMGQNYASGASNAYANMGNAGAAGAIGMSNALTGGLNNVMGIWGYQQAQGLPSIFG